MQGTAMLLAHGPACRNNLNQEQVSEAPKKNRVWGAHVVKPVICTDPAAVRVGGIIHTASQYEHPNVTLLYSRKKKKKKTQSKGQRVTVLFPPCKRE